MSIGAPPSVKRVLYQRIRPCDSVSTSPPKWTKSSLGNTLRNIGSFLPFVAIGRPMRLPRVHRPYHGLCASLWSAGAPDPRAHKRLAVDEGIRLGVRATLTL
jgi:hypothetical protein